MLFCRPAFVIIMTTGVEEFLISLSNFNWLDCDVCTHRRSSGSGGVLLLPVVAAVVVVHGEFR